MQISKLWPLVCCTALCASVTGVVQAEDNPAQAAARAALLEKISQVDAPSAPGKSVVIPPDNNPAPAPVQPAAPVPPVAPAQPLVSVPAMTPVPVTPTTQIIVPPDNAAQSQARAALLDKLSEPEPPVVYQKDNDAQAKARAALLDKLAEPEPQSSPVYQKDNDAQAAARAALVEKLNQPEAALVAPAPAPAPAVGVAPLAPAPVAVSAPAATALTPTQSVALTKEMRLKVLLIQYQTDQITPAEYHAKRAAIVGGE